MCRDHRCLTTCQKQQRQNEPAGQVDVPTRLGSMSRCISDTCRDNRCLTACQKQHRQNELAGHADIPTRVEVHVMEHPGKVVGTTDVSPPVKNNTDRMN